VLHLCHPQEVSKQTAGLLFCGLPTPCLFLIPLSSCPKLSHSAAAGKAFSLTDEQLDAAVDFLDPNQDGNVRHAQASPELVAGLKSCDMRVNTGETGVGAIGK